MRWSCRDDKSNAGRSQQLPVTLACSCKKVAVIYPKKFAWEEVEVHLGHWWGIEP